MKHLILSLLLIISVGNIFAQQTPLVTVSSTTSNNATAITVAKSQFKLGASKITLARYGAEDEKPYVILSLHNNETTSIRVAKEFVTNNGGLFLELQNNQQRVILMDLYNRTYALDPNRIFTAVRGPGLRAAIHKDERIGKEINRFSQFILNEIPADKTIVAVHNNTDREYSIRSYQKHPAIRKDAAMVHVNPEMDEDDFFLTTNTDIYEKLKEKNVNVVLQSNKAYDDGSLSIYSARNNRPYINVETQLGHEDEQKKMLAIVAEILK